MFLESIIKGYKQRKLTQPADRAIAFAGLEERVAKSFYCDAHFGNFWQISTQKLAVASASERYSDKNMFDRR